MWRLFYIGLGAVLAYFFCDKVKKSVTISVYATKELMNDKERLKQYVEQEITEDMVTRAEKKMEGDVQYER